MRSADGVFSPLRQKPAVFRLLGCEIRGLLSGLKREEGTDVRTIFARIGVLTSLVLVVLGMVQVKPAMAQESSAAFAGLATLLQPGDQIVITDTNGHKTSGRLASLSASDLQLQPGASGLDSGVPTVRFDQPDIRQIRFEHHDSLLNGTLIGFAAGAAPGIIFIAGRSNGSDPIQDPAIAASIILVPAAATAGIGALMDALFFEHRIVYRSAGQHSQLHVAPWLVPSGHGVQVSLRF